MAETIARAADTASMSPIVGKPRDQLTIDDPLSPATNTTEAATADPDDLTAYPTGTKRLLAVASLFAASMLHGLDLTIVAAAIPSLTNEFHNLDDIGWYSSAYSLMAASFSFVFGRLYTITSTAQKGGGGPKTTYLAALCIFELGSLLCTLAPTSAVFILGRAIAGAGASGIATGGFVIIARIFPREQRPLWTTAVSAAQMIGIVSSPVVGGGLIDWLGTWRGCFGINLPLGAMAIVFIEQQHQPLRSKMTKALRELRDFDILGTLLMLPAVTTFLLALQWGGIRYPWSSPRIIALLCLSAALLACFAYRQARLPEHLATLPPRIVRMRSVLAGAWFSACANATLAVTEYYVTIFFQGVLGMSPTRSGVLMLPMLIGILAGGLASGFGISRLGWYNPFMIFSTLLAPIAAGLLTTSSLDESLLIPAKVPALLGFLGVAVGLGIQTPIIALQTIMAPADLPMGVALLGFGATMGSAVWIVVSAALFQGRLAVELGTALGSGGGGVYGGGGSGMADNITQTILTGEIGLSEIRELVGEDRLRDVLLGYDEALTQTMYLPLALTVAMVLGALCVEWKSVKRKQS
ncbi:major facilitator superfamily domain-containing protein [Microdochium bolleyi]|uniref:Major facilitator superfamily domain-containing protein n=1 Tax=Microdochium bolleyi TaxID=196109 RepID=A0A136ILR5_9PEZI|nr:major facilitator superfamily domain-containing protein [Microdochium bolleyi]